MGRIAILGGTGPEGFGLGLRLALCGEEVVIGSRQEGRAREAAERSVERLRGVGCRTPVTGAENAATLDGADLIILAFPYSGVTELLPALAARLKGKLVVDVVNPLVRVNKVFSVEPIPEGSAAEAIQTRLPESQVVSAFKNESAEELSAIDRPAEGDVVVCGDHAEARRRVIDLVERIPRYRAVDAGALINARFLEGMTALLMNINRHYRALTSIHILGLPEGKGGRE